MLLITKNQQQSMGEVSLAEFKLKLADKLCQHKLLPMKSVQKTNAEIVERLIKKSNTLGLEYESDIAVLSALILANVDPEDESSLLAIPFPWMEKVLLEPEVEPDDKMTVILARWQSKLDRDNTLKPGLDTIDDLQESF